MKPKPDRRVARQRQKANKKLSRLANKGKLRKHVRDRVKEVRREKSRPFDQRMNEIRKDWLFDRTVSRRDSDESSSDEGEDLELDAAFYKHPIKAKTRFSGSEDEMGSDEVDEQLRTFVGDDADEQLLPIKVGGKLVKRMKMRSADEETGISKEEPGLENEVRDEETEVKFDLGVQREVDLSSMDEGKKALHVAKLVADVESQLASAADAIIIEPQENVSKFRSLLRMATGEELSPFVREQGQKLAVASLVELFVNVAPGYPIRLFTEAEKTQKMKKETKRLASFEQSLLNYYVKYLRLLEKHANKLLAKKVPDESSFSAQFGFLCARCMCRLAESLPHFNYAPNILSCLVRLTMTPCTKLRDETCAAISRTFASDKQLQMSLHGAKAIATLVNKKKAYVPADLVATLLSLNIKGIDKSDGQTEQKRGNKYPTQPRRRSRKYDKQVGKLDAELKEALATEKHSNKLKLATETMKFVFLTYFRILKRMPHTSLLRPVLEGFSKFAHLINVELYGDLALQLGKLVEQQQLKLSETLYCVRTASIILSGEGQLIDVDLLKFYRALFAALPNICFQSEQRIESDVALLADSLKILFVRKRKTVPSARVAAFAKRLVLVALPLRSRPQIAILQLVRQLFLNHLTLVPMIQPEVEEEDALVVSGHFCADSADPDHSNSLSVNLVDELRLFAGHPNALVRSLAQNLLNGLPATGKHRLEARWTNMEPSELFSLKDQHLEDNQACFFEEITQFCKKKDITFCSKTLCSTLCEFLKNKSRKRPR